MAYYGTFKYGQGKYKYDLPAKTDWKATDYYNADDLNRVENNTQIVANYLKNLQYNIILQTVKTNRNLTSIEFLSSINRIENNIDTIKNNFLIPVGWQSKKTWVTGREFDYTDANRYEANLSLLYSMAKIAKDNLIYSGTFSCGTEWEGGLYG